MLLTELFTKSNDLFIVEPTAGPLEALVCSEAWLLPGPIGYRTYWLACMCPAATWWWACCWLICFVKSSPKVRFWRAFERCIMPDLSDELFLGTI